MPFLKSVVLAFGMFSAIPVPRVEWSEKNLRYLMPMFPLVGAVISILYLALFLCAARISLLGGAVPVRLFALGFTLIPVLVSGGIHLDGFMDTCDALASHASREKKLAILKDSRAGSFAVLGCVLYFLSYFVLSLEVFDRFFGADSSRTFVNFFARLRDFLPVLSVFVTSRLLSAFAVATFPIAKESGLVHTFAGAGAKRFTALWCGFFFALISAALVLLWNARGIALVAAPLAVFVWYFLMARRNFGGITGDTAGCFVQLCELAGLFVFVIEKNLP